MAPNFQEFASEAEASWYAANLLAETLQLAIQTRGQAVMLLSGGSTPCDAYAALSAATIAWDKVRIGLVDDRCVAADHAGSNAGLIHRKLLKGAAAKAEFIPLADQTNPEKITAPSQLQRLQHPDICLMGMGVDGHTASWFPGSEGLDAALDIDTKDYAVTINAAGLAGAGTYPNRVSLTLPAIMQAKTIVLLITGDEKRHVFETAQIRSVKDAPVKALYAAADRLTILWAP